MALNRKIFGIVGDIFSSVEMVGTDSAVKYRY